jgi:phosphatidylinositol alpha-1,6-mannosyltransferase
MSRISSSARPRILIVTRNFPPLVGGMERLILNVTRQFDGHFEYDLVGPEGCASALTDPQRGYCCRIKPLPWFLLCSAWHSLRNALLKHYQLCIAGSGLTAPIAVAVGKLFGIPTLVFVHGLDLVVPHFIYQRLFLPFIRCADGIIANSNNTANLARQRGISAERIEVIFPGVEKPHVAPDPELFISSHGLYERKILLAVGRIVPRKGLREFIEHCMTAIVHDCPQATLVIVGDEPTSALNRSTSYVRDVEATVARRKLQEHVHFLGNVDDTTLAMAYRSARALIFPLREVAGDVEGFGMVAVEAAAHGLPTVAFDVGGVRDAVAHDISGKLVAPGDYAGFTKAVLSLLNDDAISPEECSKHATQFSWEAFGERLRTFCVRHLQKSTGI